MHRYSILLIVSGLFTLGAVATAWAEPTKVKTTVSASATRSESTEKVTYTGAVSSPKAVCKKNRKVTVAKSTAQRPLVAPFALTKPKPGEPPKGGPGGPPNGGSSGPPFGSTTTDSSGAWTIPDTEVSASSPFSLVTVTVKAKRVGNKLCKAGKKVLSSTQDGP